MKYNFKLKSFLRFKALEEQRVKMRHVQCMDQIAKKQSTIDQKKAEMMMLLSGERAFRENTRISSLMGEIKILEQEEQDLRELLEQILVEHARASYKRKALENLRDERFKEFRREENKKQQRKVEDIINQRKGYHEN